MNKWDFDWLKSFWIWLVDLFGLLGYLLTDFTQWVVSQSVVLDAMIKFLMVALLFAYSCKIYFGAKLPLIPFLFGKFKKIVGMKDKQMVMVSIAETEGKELEERVKLSKNIIIRLIDIFKKGFKVMKKIITNVFGFLRRNVVTISGILSAIAIVVGFYFKAFKPELFAKLGLSDTEVKAIVGFLTTILLISINGFGLESKERFEKRHEESEIGRQIRREQLALIKQEYEKNVALKNVVKKVEKNVVTALVERLKNSAIMGVGVYTSLSKIYTDLKWDLIVQSLGGDATKVQELISQLDKLAEEYGLIEINVVEKNVNGVKVLEEQKVNLIIAELQK